MLCCCFSCEIEAWISRWQAEVPRVASKTCLATSQTRWEMVCSSSAKHSPANRAGYVVGTLWGWFCT